MQASDSQQGHRGLETWHVSSPRYVLFLYSFDTTNVYYLNYVSEPPAPGFQPLAPISTHRPPLSTHQQFESPFPTANEQPNHHHEPTTANAGQQELITHRKRVYEQSYTGFVCFYFILFFQVMKLSTKSVVTPPAIPVIRVRVWEGSTKLDPYPYPPVPSWPTCTGWQPRDMHYQWYIFLLNFREQIWYFLGVIFSNLEVFSTVR